MVDLFTTFLVGLKQREGGATFTNRSADHGGPTKFGITAETLGGWRKLGRDATADEVEALQEPEADAIYRSEFYQAPGFDLVAQVSPNIARELIDSGVNLGPIWPARWFQEDLNALNRGGREYPDVIEDGHIGAKTISALRGLIASVGLAQAESLLLKALNGDQWCRYKAIIRAGGPNSDQELNARGWLAQRVGGLS